MKISSKDLILEFYDKVRNEYPELTVEQVRDIVSGPYRYLKDEMENGDLPEMRMMYLGSFQVYEGRARKMLERYHQSFKVGIMDTLSYQRVASVIQRFLKNKDDENKVE